MDKRLKLPALQGFVLTEILLYCLVLQPISEKVGRYRHHQLDQPELRKKEITGHQNHAQL